MHLQVGSLWPAAPSTHMLHSSASWQPAAAAPALISKCKWCLPSSARCLQSFNTATILCMCNFSSSDSCLQSFQQLADGLPYAKHVHSKLMCSITHELMTGQTHPVMLPNGNVYSQRGIEQVAAANNGRIVDPLSGKPISCCPPVQTLCTGPAGPLHGLSCAGQVYSMSELRRVYIS